MAILNLTEKQKQEDIDKTDIKKMEQEFLMSKKLSTLFRRISSDFKVFYSSTGMIPSLDLYQNSMNDILMNGYRNSASYFKNNMKRLLQTSLDQEEDPAKKEEIKQVLDIRKKSDAGILAALLLLFNSRKDQQTQFILNTTEKVMNKNLMNTLIDNPDASQVEIASKAADSMKEENVNRSDGIAETENQWAAETSKEKETDILVESSVTTGVVLTAKKQWIAFIDGRTRDAHKMANGQRVLRSEPFSVGGELLRFPGDTSLGASIWNVANCRCQNFITI